MQTSKTWWWWWGWWSPAPWLPLCSLLSLPSSPRRRLQAFLASTGQKMVCLNWHFLHFCLMQCCNKSKRLTGIIILSIIILRPFEKEYCWKMQAQIQKSWLVESDSVVNRETQSIVSSHNIKVIYSQNQIVHSKKYGDTVRSSVVMKAHTAQCGEEGWQARRAIWLSSSGASAPPYNQGRCVGWIIMTQRHTQVVCGKAFFEETPQNWDCWDVQYLYLFQLWVQN